MADPHKDWMILGERDPYFGVFSADKFRNDKIDASTREEFFQSGSEHIQSCLQLAKKYFQIDYGGKAVDFGCGVGRLTCALANHFEQVIGLDISPGMLAIAQKETLTRTRGNVTYELSSNEGALAPEEFVFAHTYLVLQHIPTPEGEEIIHAIIKSLKPSGVGMLHFTYGSPFPPLMHKVREIAKDNTLTRGISNVARGRKWDFPTMQMNKYDLSRVFEILSEYQIHEFVVHMVDDWGHRGAFIVFQKPFPGDPGSPWANPVRIGV